MLRDPSLRGVFDEANQSLEQRFLRSWIASLRARNDGGGPKSGKNMIGFSNMQLQKNLPGLKWFWWLPLFILLDIASKWLILQKLSLGESAQILSWLNFTLAYNSGIAFSLFNNHEIMGKIFLIAFIIAVCIGVGIWLAKTPISEKWSGFSLSLILGGALGNLFDRLVYGHVIDFIDFHVHSWHWYTFNLADSFITVGAFMSIITVLFSSEK